MKYKCPVCKYEVLDKDQHTKSSQHTLLLNYLNYLF